ncbi:hypothetical protein NDU88_007336, partial [Pleurodeles waltl]
SSKSAKKLHAFKDRPEEQASTSREIGGKVRSEPSTPASSSKKLKRPSSSLPPSTSRRSTPSTTGLPSSTTATATFTAPSSPMIVTSSPLSSTTITS